VLYRLDLEPRSNTVSLLVQSEKEPEWNRVDYLTECIIQKPEYKQLTPHINSGQQLHFRLRANPSVKRHTDGKANGCRVGLLREEDQLKWLYKKAEESGFTVVDCRAIPEGIIQDERGQTEKGKIRHYAVRFEGVLKVLNPDNFTDVLNNGIGPAKGFGFGLLSVAPVRR